MLNAASSLDVRGVRSRSPRGRRIGVSAPAPVALPLLTPSVAADLCFTRKTPQHTDRANDKDGFYEWANAAEETLRNIFSVTAKVMHTTHSAKHTCHASAVGMLTVIIPTPSPTTRAQLGVRQGDDVAWCEEEHHDAQRESGEGIPEGCQQDSQGTRSLFQDELLRRGLFSVPKRSPTCAPTSMEETKHNATTIYRVMSILKFEAKGW